VQKPITKLASNNYNTNYTINAHEQHNKNQQKMDLWLKLKYKLPK